MRPLKSPRKISEFQEKTIEVRRVTRVMAGGKRFSFRATVIVGNLKGKVGIGVAKGLDVASAVRKAKRLAEKNIFYISLKDGRTIPYDIISKYGASIVKIKPARKGHGLIAGGSCRTVLELVGIKDISAKILGRTTNKLTNARATIEGLKKFITKNTEPEPEPKESVEETEEENL